MTTKDDAANKAMKRYIALSNSSCLSCHKWLCVMALAARYTGEIRCRLCGAVNIFNNANRPCSVVQP